MQHQYDMHEHFLLLLVWWWEHNYIFPLTSRKLEYIFIAKLEISTRFNAFAIQLRPVAALQINDVGLDLSFLAFDTKLVFSRLLYVPELDDCMLSARARVLEHVVDDLLRAAQQPAALLRYLDRVYNVLALEYKDAPGLRW
jgi:hypothetical protein